MGLRAPAGVGDTVNARVTIVKLMPEKRMVVLSTVCTVDETVVIEGSATVLVPLRS